MAVRAWRDVVYREALSEICKLDLFASEDVENPPLYIYLHGGGLESGDKTEVNQFLPAMLDAGIAVASLDYRLYPAARYPDYLCDAAAGVAYLLSEGRKLLPFSSVVVGGTSAGAYIAMMLWLCPSFLRNAGATQSTVCGWHFNAGQPTTHYNLLRYERGEDSRAVRVDEAAPLYYLDHTLTEKEKAPRVLMEWADNDLPGRPAQLKLTCDTLLQLGFPQEKLETAINVGFEHCGYLAQPAFARRIVDFVRRACA